MNAAFLVDREDNPAREVSHDPGAPVLDVRDMRVAYGATVVLDGISFSLRTGEHVAVIGPNGAGKSTLFKAIAGVEKPCAGQVRIGGHDPSGHICIAYIPQRSMIDWSFPVTVRDVVMMGRFGRMGWLRHASRADHARVDESLNLVGMTALADRRIYALSGGEQQRMFIARALAQEAELMLMDEVLAGCDAPSQRDIHAVLEKLRERNVTIMVSTHDMDEASSRYDRVLLLNREIIGFGSVEDVFKPALLRRAYGHHLHVLPSADGVMVLSDTCCGGGVEPE